MTMTEDEDRGKTLIIISGLPPYRDDIVYGRPLAGELEQGLLLVIFRGPWLVYAFDIAIGSIALSLLKPDV